MRLPICLVTVLLLGACKKPAPGAATGEAAAPGAATAEAAASGFVEALGARDLARAERFLMSETACEKVGAPDVARCKEGAKAMREQLSWFQDGVPKGFKPGKVVVKQLSSLPPGVESYEVYEAGNDDKASSFDYLTGTKVGGRYYVIFAVRPPEDKR